MRPPKGRTECLVADGNGLYVRIRTGQDTSRTWQFRRKEAERLAIITLGTYPELSLLEARRQALDLATKRQVHSPTLAEAVERWLPEQVDPVHKKPELIHGYVTRAILPAFGDRRVRDIRPAEIAAAVREYGQRVKAAANARQGGRTAAGALLNVYKVLLKYCVTVGWLEQSPAEQLTAKAVAGPAAASRSRVLSDDELRVVLTMDAAPGPVLRFLLATGLRIGEAYAGHREGQYWVVQAASSKNKVAHRVWLSELALAQFEQHPWAGRAVVQAWATAHAGGWTAHDLRRTFSTRINGMGAAPHVVEKLLNHTLPGVMATYNRAEYLPERQEALEGWSAWLTKLVDPRPADVVRLRQPSP
jgi:integrase